MKQESPLRRAFFTAEQLAQAQSGGLIAPQQWHTRRECTTHAIDNIPPHISADRDDGIYVQRDAATGHVRMETSIADVAATVPYGSPLSPCAHTRAHTVYRRISTDPMYPKVLEGRMSLEQDEPSLAMTVIDERDAQMNPTYLEFERTIVRPDNTSYAMAYARAQTDPQFALIQSVGTQLGQAVLNKTTAMHDDAEIEHPTRQLSANEDAMSKLVSYYMINCNTRVASFFREAELPFIYRNFLDERKDSDGISRAYYGTRNLGHDALARDGLEGDYGHTTSPIRRGADYYNQLMMHYVIDGVEALERSILQAAPELEPRALHRFLWQQAGGLFQAQSRGHNPTARVNFLPRAVQLLQEYPPLKAALDAEALASIGTQFLAMRPAITQPELEGYVEQMNALRYAELQVLMNDAEHARWQKERQKSEAVDEKFARLTKAGITALRDEELIDHLGQAARYDLCHEGFMAEMQKRLSDLEPVGRNNDRFLVNAAFIILIEAGNVDEPAWRALKRTVCDRIKGRPHLMQGIFSRAKAEGYLQPDHVHLSQANLVTHMRDDNPDLPASIEAALFTYRQPDGSVVACPYFSVGHDARAAISHALYSFLEHYAFGELTGVDQALIPNMLYANLDHPETDRQDIIERMATEIGAQFKLVHYTDDTGIAHCKAIVKGGSLLLPISAVASDGEASQREAQAVKQLLRLDAFKNAFTHGDYTPYQPMLKPDTILSERLQAYGIASEQSCRPRAAGGFTHSITIGQPPRTRTFADRGPNMEQAKHLCVMQVLNAYGWLPESMRDPVLQPRVKSWVMDAIQAKDVPPASSLSAAR